MELPKIIAPEILSNAIRPFAGNGLGFPYAALPNDRRLEELAYAIYKKEVELGHLPGIDAVSLMTGSNDLGQDCRLIGKGMSLGNIQCKLYGKPLSSEDFGKEIVKFVLYALIDPSIIADPEVFSYYIVAPNGFSRHCDKLISDFSSKIADGTLLDKWIKINLKRSSFKSLTFDSCRSEVLRVLSLIQVKPVQAMDLDILLHQEYNQALLPQFFQVKTIIDAQLLKDLRGEFNDKLSGKLDPSQISLELERGSLSLTAEKNEFDGIADSHIDRRETAQLINWLEEPLHYREDNKAENICLLVANAGMGKTVILKDLCDQLTVKGKKVLGLKADKLYAVSIKELQDKANCSVPLLSLIDQAIEIAGSLILIIDQIDALSQSISSDRRFLQTYAELIQAYKHKPNIRIVVSVRIADLHFDPALRPYRHVKSIEVNKLDRAEVLTQLAKLDICEGGITPGLLELLRIPNNLDVFSRIYRRGKNLVGITSLQGLYAELWSVKLADPKGDLDSSRLIQLVNNLSDSMHSSHVITVPVAPFEEYRIELAYLKSEQLIKVEDGQVQFFHQSFYDYVFSRFFVERSASLTELIIAMDQSILVRSAIKMILNYLRDYDRQEYLTELKKILTHKKIYFHIQHLIILDLAIHDNPNQQEQELVLKSVLKNRNQAILFLRYVQGLVWMELLSRKGLLQKLYHGKLLPPVKPVSRPIVWLKKLLEGSASDKEAESIDRDLLTFLLKRSLYLAQEKVFEVLLLLKDPELSADILYNLHQWDNQKAFLIFEQMHTNGDINKRRLHGILNNMISFRPNYVFEILKDSLMRDTSLERTTYDHGEREIVKSLFAAVSERMCNFVLEKVIHLIKERQFKRDSSDIINDYAMHDANLYEQSDRVKGRTYVYVQMGRCLRAEAAANTPYYRSFLCDHLNSPYKSILKLVVYSLQGNEAIYVNEAYKLFEYLYKTLYIFVHEGFNYQVRVLLKNVFPHFSEVQKALVVTMIRSIVVPTEVYVRKNEAGERDIRSFWGYQQFLFLRVIPIDYINTHQELKRAVMAMVRKHPDIIDRGPSISIASAVSPPLRASAYISMTIADWRATILKYTWAYESESHRGNSGGIWEHSRKFRDAVKSNHKRFSPFVREMLNDPEFERDYPVSGILGITELEGTSALTKSLFEELIRTPIADNLYNEYITIADHLVGEEDYGDDIIIFLIKMSVEAPEKDLSIFYEHNKEEEVTSAKLIEQGNYSERTRAILALMHVNKPKYEDVVFRAVECFLKAEKPENRAAVINSMAYLNYLNIPRAYELFMSTVMEPANIPLLAAGLSASQYMVKHDYIGVLPYFNLVSTQQLAEKDEQSLTTVLYSNWLLDDPGAERLFLSYIASRPSAQVRAVEHAFDHFYINEGSKSKSLKIFSLVLDLASQKGKQRFELEFIDMDKIAFDDLVDFLKNYVKSSVFQLSDYFLDYLIQQCAKYPFECVDLFWAGLNNRHADHDPEDHFRHQEDKTIKFIVGAYNMMNSLNDKRHLDYKHKLMTAFDTVLKDKRFWRDAEDALEKIIN